ncbi:MAG: homoserine dehydrogenase [candidate division FCPU426 bacterium]
MARKKKIVIGLLGLGTVGSGVAELLEKNRQHIESRVGAQLEIKAALVRDLSKARSAVPASTKITQKPSDILDDPEIDLVVELMGGFEPARTYILQAISKGKHVVTANKAVMAKHWDEIFQAAHDKGVEVYLEASVGAGIPCVQAINDGLAANRIQELTAIINGTTNFILTGMAHYGQTFEKSLKDAQAKGYAEADPSFDIDGTDACHKLAILSSIAFDQRVRIEDIHLQGIRGITKADIDAARTEMNCTVKHLAIARSRDESGAPAAGLEIQVVPALIPLDHPLAGVEGVYNGILVTGDAVGRVMLSGRGAGKMPTASAVISDIIYIARNVAVGVAGKVPAVAYDVDHVESRRIVPADEIRNRFFLRFTAMDQPGVLARIASILAEHGISISSVAQNERQKGSSVPVYLSTYTATEKAMREAIATIEALPAVKQGTLVMRLEIPENYSA